MKAPLVFQNKSISLSFWVLKRFSEGRNAWMDCPQPSTLNPKPLNPTLNDALWTWKVGAGRSMGRPLGLLVVPSLGFGAKLQS